MLQITREQASIYINADYWRFYIHFKEISKKALCTRNRFLFSFLSKDGSQEKCKSEATHKFRTFSEDFPPLHFPHLPPLESPALL